MTAHLVLNLLNESILRDKIQGSAENFINSYNESNKFNHTKNTNAILIKIATFL